MSSREVVTVFVFQCGNTKPSALIPWATSLCDPDKGDMTLVGLLCELPLGWWVLFAVFFFVVVVELKGGQALGYQVTGSSHTLL